MNVGAFFLSLVLTTAASLVAWSQEGDPWVLDVKVLSVLVSHVYSWSPDGKRLAYAADDGIWSIEAPGFDRPRRLIRKGRGEDHPIEQILWSPDGQKLAFVSSRPGDDWTTIWLAEADGSRIRDLLPPGSPFTSPGVRSVEISAWLSNREIAFAEHSGTGSLDFHRIHGESGAFQNLCTGEVDGGYDWAPAKGRAILEMHLGSLGLVEGKSTKPASSKPVFKRCRTILQGCTIKEGKLQGEEYHFSDWSPDGKQFLYMGWTCGKKPATESKVHLYLWDLGRGSRQRLLPNAGWAVWSPDGSKIAFLLLGEPRYDRSKRIIGTDFATNRPSQAYLGIMEVATKDVRTLVPLGSQPIDPESVAGWSEPLAWSPDGQQLAVWNGQGELFLIRSDGSERRLISRGRQVEASWSPDGKRLALQLVERYWFPGESQGLERFLPPVGKEEAFLSDAEIVERYFQRFLAIGPKALGSYPWFLGEYAEALEEMGKVKAAEEQYRKAIEMVRRSKEWRGTSVATYLENSYADFLRRQRREKEAAELSTNAVPRRLREAMSHRGVPSGPTGEWAETQMKGHPARPRTEPFQVPQEPPSLYIVEVPER